MRFYSLLLRLYPASFRHEYGAEMRAIVARRLREAGPLARVFVWFDAIADLVVNASRVQLEVTSRERGTRSGLFCVRLASP